MYYLNNDGSLDDGPVKSIENNPVEIASVSCNDGKIDSQYTLVEPHVDNCKCVKCFIKNKVGPTVTYNNALMVIIFLIFVYLIYLLLIRLFYS